MSYYIGIDGGGTSTKCVVADENLNQLFHFSGGPSNFRSCGIEPAVAVINDILQRAYASIRDYSGTLSGIMIGAAGAGRLSDAEYLKNEIIKRTTEEGLAKSALFITSDAKIALEGAFGGKEGIILIAGTGSIAFGKSDSGDTIRSGGLGRIIGDEGSGYDIGRKALAEFGRFLDGRSKHSGLFSLITQIYQINNIESLIDHVYGKGVNPAEIAPLVIKMAEDKDSLCLGIIDSAVDDLMALLNSVKNRLRMTKPSVSLMGGLLSSVNYYSSAIRKRLIEDRIGFSLTDALFSPEMGAVIYLRNILAEKNE